MNCKLQLKMSQYLIGKLTVHFLGKSHQYRHQLGVNMCSNIRQRTDKVCPPPQSKGIATPDKEVTNSYVNVLGKTEEADLMNVSNPPWRVLRNMSVPSVER